MQLIAAVLVLWVIGYIPVVGPFVWGIINMVIGWAIIVALGVGLLYFLFRWGMSTQKTRG